MTGRPWVAAIARCSRRHGDHRRIARRAAADLGGRRTRLRGTLLVLVSALVVVPAPLAALQARPDARLENRMLRQASGQEARGELEQAEATLRELLVLQPGSSAAVFALERVFRRGDRLPELLPVMDEFLQRDASAGRVWGLKVDVLAELGSLPDLDEALRDWIGAAPGSPDPYLQGAEAFQEVFGSERAAELLEEGRAALGESPQLLVELGDMYVAAGRLDDAAEAWARALGRDRARSGAVFRRIEDLDDESGAAAARIVAALGREPTNVTRLEAGAELALREDLEDDAMTLAAAALTRIQDREARGFLNGFARKAEDNGRDRSALWAYARLREITRDPAEARSTDERLADAALVAGDTAVALEALRRITESHRVGSEARRAAWTAELRIQVASPEMEGATEALAAFRDEFPESPDLDALSAALASRLLGRGMREEAMEVLSGIEGPGAALERAFLLLEGGAFPEGIAALQASLPELEPSDATEILELTLALSELTPPGGMLASEVAIARHRGHAEDGVRAVRERIDAVPAQDRSAILAQGARAADQAGLSDEAVQFRRRIVAEYPDAREFAEAALRLARAVAAEPGGRDEAVRILEALIVSRPDSPVVPGARRELRRIQEGGSL